MMNHTAAAVLTGGLLGIALMGSLAFTTPDEPEQEGRQATQVEGVTEEVTAIEVTEEAEEAEVTEEAEKPEGVTEVEPEITQESIGDKTPAEVEAQYPGMDFGELICGKDAAPAIDYNEEWGWWAYCEPAMVTEEGTLWKG